MFCKTNSLPVHRQAIAERCAIINRSVDEWCLMKYTLAGAVLLLAVCANAQFIKNIDEDGNVSYTADPRYDYSQDESGAPQSNSDLEQVEEYLRERDESAKREQAKNQSSNSSIGIGHDPTGITQRLRYRRCHSLWRLGLKCR